MAYVVNGERTPAGSGSGPVLDRGHLDRYTLGDAALERELLNLFLDQTALSIAQLKSANSASEWKLASHSLKGSAAAIGATELNAIALELEIAGFSGRPSDQAGRLARLDVAAARFRAAVAPILA